MQPKFVCELETPLGHVVWDRGNIEWDPPLDIKVRAPNYDGRLLPDRVYETRFGRFVFSHIVALSNREVQVFHLSHIVTAPPANDPL